MTINEVEDIYSTGNNDCYYVHTISSDYKMGTSISSELNKRYNLKYKLSRMTLKNPDCVLIDRVFNLISKDKYWHKPTYEDLKSCLISMKSIIIKNNIKNILMPKIGCEIDKLNWQHVKKMIHDIFNDIDINISIYSPK